MLPEFSELLFIKTILIGVICGMVARIFVDLTHGATRLFLRVRTRFGLWSPIMPVLGGCLLAVWIFVIPTKYLRSEEGRVGKECVRSCRTRVSRYNKEKKSILH